MSSCNGAGPFILNARTRMGLPDYGQCPSGSYFQLVFVTDQTWSNDIPGGQITHEQRLDPPFNISQASYDNLVQTEFENSSFYQDISGYLNTNNWEPAQINTDPSFVKMDLSNVPQFRAIVSTTPCSVDIPSTPGLPLLFTQKDLSFAYPFNSATGLAQGVDPSSTNTDDQFYYYYPDASAGSQPSLPGLQIFTFGNAEKSREAGFVTGGAAWHMFLTHGHGGPAEQVIINRDASGSIRGPIGDYGEYDCSFVWTGTSQGPISSAANTGQLLLCTGGNDATGWPLSPGSTPCTENNWGVHVGTVFNDGTGALEWYSVASVHNLVGATGTSVSYPSTTGRLYGISQILMMPGVPSGCGGNTPPTPSRGPVDVSANAQLQPPQYLQRPPCLPTCVDVPAGELFQLAFVTECSWTVHGPQGQFTPINMPPVSACHTDYDNLVRQAWQNSDLREGVEHYFQSAGNPPQDISWNALVSTKAYAGDPSTNANRWDTSYFPPPPGTGGPITCGVFTMGDCSCQTHVCDASKAVKVADGGGIPASNQGVGRGLWNSYAGNPLPLLAPINHNERGRIIGVSDISAVWTGTNNVGGAAAHALGPWSTAPAWIIGCCQSVSSDWITWHGPEGGTAAGDVKSARLYALSNVLRMPSLPPAEVSPPPTAEENAYDYPCETSLFRPHCLPKPADVAAAQTFQMIFVTSKTWDSSGCNGGPVPFSTRHHDYDQLVNEVWQQSDLSGVVERFLACGDADPGDCFDPLTSRPSIKWSAIVSTNNSNFLCPPQCCYDPYEGQSPPNARDWICPMSQNNSAGIFTFGDCSLCSFDSGTNPDCWCPYDASASAGCSPPPPAADISRNDWNRPKRIFYGGSSGGGIFCPWGPLNGFPFNPINTDENGKLLDGSVDPSFVWTGTNESGHCDQLSGLGFGGPDCFKNPVHWTIGEMDASGVASWIKSPNGVATPGGIGSRAGLRLYAISELLIMPHAAPPPPPPPPPNPAIKAPIVKKRIGVCEPLCGINLQSDNVVQPQPPNESAKMRGAKRVRGRGWRRVSLNTYKEMKKGNMPLLGKCYHKYRK